MSDIDKKVVQIDFDNKKFEKNVKQSQESLGELKKSLNFDSVSKSIDQVTVKISALEIATTTFIANLSNRIVNFGIQMVESLSVDNISSGWIKYGQKTTAVATMMAQSFKIAGKELTDQSEKMAAVTEQLERLSWFSDETSYTFTDMVDNVGKFIAAGQDLDVSVKAMEGIATWAALSGQNATTASRAMYQLSQAMGKGKIQLIDYKSIQNANMDTVEFRQTILETAVALGQLTKEGDKFVTKTGKKFTQSQFAEQLSSGWFTSEVLVKGLEKYSSAVEQIYALAEKEGKTATEIIEEYGDTLDSFGLKAFKAAQEARTFADVLNSVRDAVSSKWMTTSELIFGDKDQAVELWTSLSNALYEVFAEGGNFRNEILKVWNSLGGREDLFKRGGKDQGAFWNIYDAIIAVKDLIKSAWNTIFPLSEMEDESDQAQDIGNSLKTLTKRFQLFTKSLQMSSETSLRLRKIFEGIFSVLKFGLQVLQAIRFVLDPIFKLGKKIITFVLDKLVALTNSVNISGDTLFKVAEKLNSVLEKMLITIKNGSGILGSIKKLIVNVGNNITKFFEDLFDSFKSSNKLKSFFSAFITFIKNLFSNFKLLKPVFESIVKLFKDFVRILLNLPKALNNVSKSLTGNGIVDNIKKIFESIAKTFNKFAESILSDKRLSGKMKALQPLSDLLKGILVFFKGVLTLTNAIITLAGKALQATGTILQAIGNLILYVFDGSLISDLDAWQKALLLTAAILAGIAVILGVIANIIKNIIWSVTSLINPFAVIADSMSGVLDKYAVKMVASSVKVIADSILEMTVSLIFIASIDPEKLKRAAIVVSILSIVLAGVTAALIVIADLALKSNKAVQTTALAIKSTTKTIKNNFVNGLTSIADSFNNIQNKLIVPQSISMVLRSFSTALIKIAASFLIVSKLSWDEIGKGMTVLAGVLATTLIIALFVGENVNDIAKAAPSFAVMLTFAAILKTFAKTLASFKDFSGSQMSNVWSAFGLIELFLASMTGIIVLLNRYGKSRNASKVIREILSMSLLLFSFGVTIQILSKIPWDQLVVPIISVVSLFAIIGFLFLSISESSISIAKSKSVLITLIGLSATLVTFGLSMKTLANIPWKNILAATLSLFALFASLIGLEAAITAMGKSGTEIFLDFSAISLSLVLAAQSLLTFAKAFSIVSSLNLLSVGSGFLVLAGALVVLGVGAKILGPFSVQLLAVSASIMLVGAGLLLIATSLQVFVAAVSTATDTIVKQFQSFGAIAETIADTVMNVINIIIEKIIENAGTIFSSIGDLIANSLDLVNTILPKVGETLDKIASLLGEYLPKFANIILDVITSIATSLNKNMSTIVSQVIDIFTKILDGLTERMDDIVVSILKFIKELLSSLRRNIQLINNITKSLVNLLVQALLGVAKSITEVAGLIAEIILAFLAAALRLAIQSIGAVSELMMEFIGGILLLFVKIAIGMNSVWYQLFRTILYNIANVLFALLTDLPSDFWNLIKTAFQSLWVGILRVFYDMTKNIPFVGDWFKGILDDAERNLADTKGNIADIISGSNVETAINNAKKNITNSIKNTTNSIKDTTKESLNTIKETIDDAKNDFNNIFQQLGESVGDGYQKGIDESSDDAINAAADMAIKSSEAVAEANDSHSPSRVFEKLGMFTVLGYAKGVNENTSKAINSMTFMAENALNAAQEILENQNGDDITLKVGLDISSVEGQAQKVSDIMTGINKVDASIYGQNAFYNAKVLKDTQKDKSSTSTTSTSNVTYNNVFNVTSTDPEESADEIDKALSKQAMRAKLAHGNI